MKRYFIHVTLLALMVITTGCGNVFGPGANSISVKGIGNNDTSTGVDPWGNDNNYSCSDNYNITPNNSSYSDRTGYYSVCTALGVANYWNILVHGKTSTSDTICVFPAQEGTDGDFAWIRDPARNEPTSLCAPATASGAYFSFPTLSRAKIGFNSVMIVEAPDLESMKRCLVQHFNTQCPNFSSGRFR